MKTDIEVSEIMIAKILLYLQPFGIYQTSVLEKDFAIDGIEKPNLFYSAVRWQKNEGMLHYESSSYGQSGLSFSGVCLSSKGYSALNRKFFANHDQSGLEVTESVSKGDSGVGKLGEFLGDFFGGFVSSQG